MKEQRKNKKKQNKKQGGAEAIAKGWEMKDFVRVLRSFR